MKTNLKKAFASLVVLLAVICLLLFSVSFKSVKPVAGGFVRGSTSPPAIGLRAFLFTAKDTLSVNVVNDAFQFSNVPSGVYKLLVEASPPYRNAVKEGLRVIDGEFTDAGQIELQK